MQKYPMLANLAEFNSDLGIWEIEEDDWAQLLTSMQKSLASSE